MTTISAFANAQEYSVDTQLSSAHQEGPVLTAAAIAGVLAMGAAMFAAGNMVTDYVGAETPVDPVGDPTMLSADDTLAVRDAATQI